MVYKKELILAIVIISLIIILNPLFLGNYIYKFFFYPSECEQRSNIYMKYSCLSRHAKEENNSNLCYQIDDELYRIPCLLDLEIIPKIEETNCSFGTDSIKICKDSCFGVGYDKLLSNSKNFDNSITDISYGSSSYSGKMSVKICYTDFKSQQNIICSAKCSNSTSN